MCTVGTSRRMFAMASIPSSPILHPARASSVTFAPLFRWNASFRACAPAFLRGLLEKSRCVSGYPPPMVYLRMGRAIECHLLTNWPKIRIIAGPNLHPAIVSLEIFLHAFACAKTVSRAVLIIFCVAGTSSMGLSLRSISFMESATFCSAALRKVAALLEERPEFLHSKDDTALAHCMYFTPRSGRLSLLSPSPSPSSSSAAAAVVPVLIGTPRRISLTMSTSWKDRGLPLSASFTGSAVMGASRWERMAVFGIWSNTRHWCRYLDAAVRFHNTANHSSFADGESLASE
mmetsp:Transcript_21355/g.29917  ORF Transcript_21355/g.29917 Transcript_21355/m.29917 type:complete len:289 (+) Transcript_21355:545-1411(+)